MMGSEVGEMSSGELQISGFFWPVQPYLVLGILCFVFLHVGYDLYTFLSTLLD